MNNAEIIPYDEQVALSAQALVEGFKTMIDAQPEQPEGFSWANPVAAQLTQSTPKPMTHEQIGKLFDVNTLDSFSDVRVAEIIDAVRRVEHFHGIA